ncbi:MAG: APC family permease [Eubacteriaceae bacterium]|nr:APC family permease [Eubacteriaceae bacterium]
MSQEVERQELAKALNMKDVLALAFGTMIGWGWIMLAGQWVASGGVLGAIIAFAIGAIMCIFVGLAYAELTPALPLSGGELVFSYRAMGYNASWFTGWMITLAYIGVAAWEGPALATAIGYLFEGLLPQGKALYQVQGFDITVTFLIIAIGGAVILTIINLLGAKSSAVFQTCATLAMAIGGVAFFVGSCVKGDISNMVPVFTGGKGLVSVILMVPAMFVGFDVIPQAAEEMNIPLGKIGKVIIIAIVMAACWYMMMILAIALAAPGDVRYVEGSGNIGVADSFAYCMGHPGFGKFMIVAAMCGILTSWNGFIVGASRVLFSMGRAKMLPKVFAAVHPKFKSPVVAVLLVGLITALSPLLGKGALVWFVDAAAMGTVVAYFMVSLSFLILRKKEPDLKRPYKVKGGVVVGVLAVCVSFFFLYLYLPLGSPAPLTGIEWCLVGGWIVLGVIFFIINKITMKHTHETKKEIEYLMFGNDYKRF